jgi:hypothetical protein
LLEQEYSIWASKTGGSGKFTINNDWMNKLITFSKIYYKAIEDEKNNEIER